MSENTRKYLADAVAAWHAEAARSQQGYANPAYRRELEERISGGLRVADAERALAESDAVARRVTS